MRLRSNCSQEKSRTEVKTSGKRLLSDQFQCRALYTGAQSTGDGSKWGLLLLSAFSPTCQQASKQANNKIKKPHALKEKWLGLSVPTQPQGLRKRVQPASVSQRAGPAGTVHRDTAWKGWGRAPAFGKQWAGPLAVATSVCLCLQAA